MVVAGGDNGADAGQMGRMGDGREQLRGSHIGAAEHADLAVGVGQGGGPLHGVVAVFDLMLEGIPFAFGGIAAAHILRHYHEAAQCAHATKGGGVALVVGCAGEQHREASVACGAIDVGEEGDAVAGLHGNVALDVDVGLGLGEQRPAGRDGKGAKEQQKRFFQHGIPRRRKPRPF